MAQAENIRPSSVIISTAEGTIQDPYHYSFTERYPPTYAAEVFPIFLFYFLLKLFFWNLVGTLCSSCEKRRKTTFDTQSSASHLCYCRSSRPICPFGKTNRSLFLKIFYEPIDLF